MSNRPFPLNQHCWFFEAFAEFCTVDTGNLPGSSEQLTLIQKHFKDIWSEQAAYKHSWRLLLLLLVCGRWRSSGKKAALAGIIVIILKMVPWSSNQWMLKRQRAQKQRQGFLPCQGENWNWFRNFCPWEYQQLQGAALQSHLWQLREAPRGQENALASTSRSAGITLNHLKELQVYNL